MKLQSIDPTNGELIESFDEISDADLAAALSRAQQTFRTYRRTSFAERARWLLEAAQILEEESLGRKDADGPADGPRLHAGTASARWHRRLGRGGLRAQRAARLRLGCSSLAAARG